MKKVIIPSVLGAPAHLRETFFPIRPEPDLFHHEKVEEGLIIDGSQAVKNSQQLRLGIFSDMLPENISWRVPDRIGDGLVGTWVGCGENDIRSGFPNSL